MPVAMYLVIQSQDLNSNILSPEPQVLPANLDSLKERILKLSNNNRQKAWKYPVWIIGYLMGRNAGL